MKQEFGRMLSGINNAKISLNLDDVFLLSDMVDRKLYLDYEIDEDSVREIRNAILYFNNEDRGLAKEDRQPIWLYIASRGGSVSDGFSLVDLIVASKTPVYTVNIGYCYSMALPIFLVGHKRYALKNSQFLMHDGTMFCIDSSSKAQDCMEFESKYEKEVTRKTILEHSNLTEEQYESKRRVEWYLLAEDAKGYGMVDEIVEDLEKIS